ncbi:MAG: hypothetical protein ACYTKC_04440 [Planctomycetota bacterium]|jgi:tetratricopeptide (TPR) repeat protein
MKITLLPGVSLLLLLYTSCAAPGNSQQNPAETNQRLQEAQDLYQRGQLDEALTITDALLREDPKLRPARLLAADANLALAASGRNPAQLFVQDAIRNLRQALRQDEQDADIYLALSNAYLQLGQHGTPNWTAGRDAALKAAALYTQMNAGTDKVGQAVLMAGKHELRIFIEARRPELEAGEQAMGAATFEKANTVLARLEKAKQTGTDATRGDAFIHAALALEWMSRTLEAIHELERGLAVVPDYMPLHNHFQQLHNRMERQEVCAAVYRRLIKEHGRSVGLLHGVALSQSNLADKYRKDRKYPEATKAYQAAAEACDEILATGGPETKQYYTDWQAIIHLSLSSLNLEVGDIEAAKREAFLAYDTTPRALEVDASGYPLLRGYGDTPYLLCIENVGRALVSSRDPAFLRAGLKYWEEVIARHPDKFGWMYNNAGLCARDLGSSLANPRGQDPDRREQGLKDAMAMWERSYAHYQKAAKLSPDDARIVNDCALMLVYHLKRDYDVALKLLQQSIVTGKEQLAALPEDADRQQRESLEEAVGDAYQNTAVMFQNQGKPYSAYEDLLKEAVKYYPYQLRQAARMLRDGPRQRQGADADATPKPDPRIAEFQKTLEEARKKADAGDFDGALLVLDGVQRRMQGHAPFHYHVGLYSLRYGQQVIARTGPGSQIDALLGDARIELQKAVQLDGEPVEPRLYLAQANFESQEYVNAAKISESLLSHIASRGGTSKELHAEALKLRAQAGTRVYVASRQGDQKDQENKAELQAARSSFRALEKMDGLDTKLLRDWAALEGWAGRNEEATAIFARAAQRRPQDQDILGGLVKQAREAKNSSAAVKVLADRKDAIGLWFLGQSRYYHALELLAAGKTSEGLKALAQSTQGFLGSMQANPAYTNDCKAWIAICLAEEGFAQLGAKRYRSAEDAFLAAAKERPDRVAAWFDANRSKSVKRGLVLVVDHHYQNKNLAAAERITRAATVLLPGDADFANDHGLFARDHGVALEAAGNKEAAVVMWEASYASYQRAAKLEPENLRLINDLALLQVYHLHRELRQAKAQLRHCIKLAEERLKNNPPAEEQALRDLQETLGDCHQNLGYCLMVHDKQYDEARKHFNAALKCYPFDKRDSAQHLKKLDALRGKKK